jgi:hypothetical protein
MKKVFVCLFVLVLAGCAANPEKLATVAQEESARMAPTSEPLSAFGSFELQPMTMSDTVRSDAGKVKQAKLLEDKLRAKLIPLFEEWEHDGNGTGRKLLVQPSVARLRIVSGGARFWAGAFAGDSHIDMDLKLVDASTEEVVGAPRINIGSGGMGGAWSVGATDRNLLDYVAAISNQYLVANYKRM